MMLNEAIVLSAGAFGSIYLFSTILKELNNKSSSITKSELKVGVSEPSSLVDYYESAAKHLM